MGVAAARWAGAGRDYWTGGGGGGRSVGVAFGESAGGGVGARGVGAAAWASGGCAGGRGRWGDAVRGACRLGRGAGWGAGCGAGWTVGVVRGGVLWGRPSGMRWSPWAVPGEARLRCPKGGMLRILGGGGVEGGDRGGGAWCHGVVSRCGLGGGEAGGAGRGGDASGLRPRGVMEWCRDVGWAGCGGGCRARRAERGRSRLGRCGVRRWRVGRGLGRGRWLRLGSGRWPGGGPKLGRAGRCSWGLGCWVGRLRMGVAVGVRWRREGRLRAGASGLPLVQAPRNGWGCLGCRRVGWRRLRRPMLGRLWRHLGVRLDCGLDALAAVSG